MVNKKFTNVFTIFICSIIEKLFSKNKSIKYYFYGLKYKELILSLPREEVCIIGGPRQIIFCFINSISFVSIIDIWPFLTSGLTLGCWGPENQERIDRKVFYLRRKLLATYNAAAYLIMINDTMPMERMLINSIKLSKIKSIVIQHGIFSAGAHKAAADGFYSDYIFCISNLQKGIIESKGISSSKVIEMGFGHSVYKTKRTGISNPKKICFLGQQWVVCCLKNI
jgi:hypothetical protein